ncbi:DUF350 domain-containing protein [Candidatus Saccharibacteria bacterium]|nr:MAG: DUF350 domain-containing protein [Candidatus Saccharibacteria bacterium]
MINSLVLGFIGILPFVIVASGLWMVYKTIHDRLTHYDDKAELSAGNTAAGLARAGAYLGVGIAASGSLIGSNEPFWFDLLMFMIDGLVAIGVFTVASFVLDAVILRKIRNADHIVAGNMAVAVLEASALVSLGIIMSAAFSGGGQNILAGLGSAVLYSFIGLATIALIYLAFCGLYRLVHKCVVEKEIKQNNVGLASEAGGVLLGMSITLWFSISGDFTGWLNDFVSYAIAAGSSVLAVGVAWFLSGRLLTGVPSVKDGTHLGNVAIGVIKMFALMGFGLIAGLVTFS